MHSWRALLLPYFEKGVISSMLLNAYDYSQPWDSPHNQKLWNRSPPVYRCAVDTKGAARTTTSYFAVVGDETFWPFEKSRTPKEIADGLSDTIAIVEVAGQEIPWLEPRDIDIASLNLQINDPSTKDRVSSEHPAGANVLMADGSSRFLPDTLDPQAVEGVAHRRWRRAGRRAIDFVAER